MAPRDGDISFKLGLDIDGLSRSTDAAEDKLTKSFKFIGKASMDLNKRWKKVTDSAEKNNKKLLLSSRNQRQQIQNITESVTMQGAMVKALAKIQATAGAEDIKVTKDRIAAYGRWGETVLAAMQKAKDSGMDEVEALGKIKDELKKTSDSAKESLKELKMEAFGAGNVAALDAIQQMKDEAEKARADLTSKYLTYKAGGDIGEGFREVVSGIGGKDMKGMASGLLKGLGALGKGAGAGMSRFAAKTKADPNAGAMAKTMGKVAGSLGGMVGMLAKIGPLLSMTAGMFMGILKLLMDAESAAKEFNKDLLATASTSEFLQEAGGESNLAFQKLRETVDSIRDAAVDAGENLKWGITKKTHLEFLNTLNAEGVSVHRIATEAEKAKKSAGDFSAEMVHVGVAYSRHFAVSLSEIATLQAEMTNDMGVSLDGVKDQWAMLAKSANESGIASNKFFAIMRAMSADMSLFNLRMEDVAGTMKLLSKSMNTKNAEAFMKTITGFYKQMDLSGRIKATLLGGEKETHGRLQKDLTVNLKNVSGKVAEKIGGGVKPEDVTEAIKGGPKTMSAFLAKHQKALGKDSAALKEAMYDAQDMNAKLSKNSMISTASALRMASPVTTMEQLQAIALRNTGKKLDDLQGADLLAAGRMMDMSDEQIAQVSKAQQGIDQVRTELVAQLKTNAADLSEEQKDLAKRLGITGGTAEDIAKAEKIDNRTLWAAMTDAEKANFKPAKTALDFAQRQSELTLDLATRLDIIADYLLNLVYKGIMLVLDAMPGAGEQQAAARAQMTVMKSGDKGLIDAFNQSANLGEFHGKAITESGAGKQTASILMNTASEIEELNKKSEEQVKIMNDSQKSEAEKKAASDEINRLAKEKDAKSGAMQDVVKAMQVNFSKSSKDEQGMMLSDVMQDAIKSGLVKKPKTGTTDAAVGNVLEGADWQTALSKAGFNEDEIGKIMGKALWKLSPEQVAGVLGAQAKKSAPAPGAKSAEKPGETPAAPDAPKTTGEKPPSPQAQASAPPAAPPPGAPGAPPATREGTTTPIMPVAQGPAAPEVKATAAATQATVDYTQTAAATLLLIDSKQGEIVKVLMGKTGMGVVLGAPKGDAFGKGAIEKPVLEALREGLFEFWLYMHDEPDEKKLKEIAAAGGGKLSAKGNLKAQQKWMQEHNIAMDLPGMADGGMVDRVQGGIAVVRPAAGEGVASVGAGEKVLPKGGGGSTIKVELSFKDGMERFVEAKALDTMYDSKRREKNH